MDAVGVLLIGIGAWLMYEAWKSSTPAPITNAKSLLGNAAPAQLPAAA